MLASVNSCVVHPTYQNIETWAKQVVCVVMSMSMKRSGGDGFLSALAAKAAATITERIRQDRSGSKTRRRPGEYRGDFSEGSVQAGSTLFVDTYLTYWDYFYVLT